MARKSRPKKTPPGFKWQGNKLVPLESTTYTEEGGWEVDPSQLEEPPPPVDSQGNTLLTNQDYDPGSEVNTFTKDDQNDTVVTTDTYGVSGDDSTKTTTTETIPRERSQAEIDYYAALDAGEDPKITQEHLNEIAPGAGQMYVSDFYGEQGPGVRQTQETPATEKSGSLRRGIRKMAPSLINKKAS